MSKARSDSVLKARAEQSEEFGSKLWDWCHEPKTATCAGGLAYAREQLAADGLTLAGGWKRQLSEFCSWWELRADMAAADHEAQNIQELLRQNPTFTAQQIDAAGQLVFTQRAFSARNAEEYREMEYLRLQKETARTKAELEKAKLELRKRAEDRNTEKLALEREKWETLAAEKMLSAAMRAKADEINASSMSNAAKIAAMRQAAFAEIDELQASGKVVIPE